MIFIEFQPSVANFNKLIHACWWGFCGLELHIQNQEREILWCFRGDRYKYLCTVHTKSNIFTSNYVYWLTIKYGSTLYVAKWYRNKNPEKSLFQGREEKSSLALYFKCVRETNNPSGYFILFIYSSPFYCNVIQKNISFYRVYQNDESEGLMKVRRCNRNRPKRQQNQNKYFYYINFFHGLLFNVPTYTKSVFSFTL